MDPVNIWALNLGLKINIWPFLIHFMQHNVSLIKKLMMHFLGKNLYPVGQAKLSSTSVVILSLNRSPWSMVKSLLDESVSSVNNFPEFVLRKKKQPLSSTSDRNQFWTWSVELKSVRIAPVPSRSLPPETLITCSIPFKLKVR